VFLVVIAVVVMVMVYAVIMGLVLCLCCYCYKNKNKIDDKVNTPSYQKQDGGSMSSPEPFKPPERMDSLISRETIGKEPISQLNYYDLPHPFSHVSSDGRSHDTLELIRVPPPQVCMCSDVRYA